MLNEIMFGGKALPVVVEEFPAIRHAARKHKTYNVPGRNGDIIIQQDAFENLILPYKVFAGTGSFIQDSWSDIADLLYLNGYQKLQDIADPGIFRLATYNGPTDAEFYWKQTGRATLEFNCRPERFLNSGDISETYCALLDLNNDPVVQKIDNPTAWTAKPLIIAHISSGGSGTITVNGVALTLSTVPGTQIVLDCEREDAYLGATNLNAYVSGTFPTFVSGENTLLLGGDITSLDITPRWWEI